MYDLRSSGMPALAQEERSGLADRRVGGSPNFEDLLIYGRNSKMPKILALQDPAKSNSVHWASKRCLPRFRFCWQLNPELPWLHCHLVGYFLIYRVSCDQTRISFAEKISKVEER
ncbi:uncharacterized protein BDCG_16051 [Blastomyces dermatitidis ER-3]|uniref:Uncharacterized protein n=1 Tax=Ajellomyces dermatitidis (strain ER-3 / ATCC MYA-2586) TaxID=559297 RepID=A0ABX2VQT3_AJEDR|nr:uncharacterized protein BDCG_16051 [Blastomyces dermatitidis ER-3]OAS99279.1 hypothetical protein BDCG_16051 [Blastomyces dermatitidis ER-3]